ncbi:hypothetical protein SALBM311S_11069 [Streptomyces alboniger]
MGQRFHTIGRWWLDHRGPDWGSCPTGGTVVWPTGVQREPLRSSRVAGN